MTDGDEDGEDTEEHCEPLVELKVTMGSQHESVGSHACELAEPTCSKLKDSFLVLWLACMA